MTLAGDPDSQTRPLRVGIGGPVGSGKTALVEAATFSPELADLTMTALQSNQGATRLWCMDTLTPSREVIVLEVR